MAGAEETQRPSTPDLDSPSPSDVVRSADESLPLFSDEDKERWAKDSKEQKERLRDSVNKALLSSSKHMEKAMASPFYKHRKTKTPTKKRKSPEGDVQTAIIKWLNRNGIWAWRANRSGMPIRDKFGMVVGLKPSTLPAGHADIVGILPDGRALFCEVKAPGKKPTPEQLDFIAKVNAHGGVAFWADSLEVCITRLDTARQSATLPITKDGTV